MSTVNLVSTPLIVHNLYGPEKDQSKRRSTITAFLEKSKGGLGAFNELSGRDLDFIKAEAAERGLKFHNSGPLGMVWDPTIYRVGTPRKKKIMQGGYVGADGVATPQKGDDDRRVGPNRYALYYPVTVLALQFTFEFVVTHFMARSFTAHKWRQKLFWRAVDSMADGVLEEDALFVGDYNHSKRTDLPGLAEVDVAVPKDMGGQRYTRIQRLGRHIYVSSVKAVNTWSDHHMITAKVTFYRFAQDKLGPAPVTPSKPDIPTSPVPVSKPPLVPKPRLPKPGKPGVNWRRLGSPVRHPWSKRARRFWSKKTRAKVDKWQTAYRRRL